MARIQRDPNDRLFTMLADFQRRLRALETRASGGVAFTAFTPVCRQNGNVVTSTDDGSFHARLGDLVFLIVALTVTGSGTAGTLITVDLPVDTETTQEGIGFGRVQDVGTAAYNAMATVSEGTQRLLFRDTNDLTGSAIGINPSFALASGDVIDSTGWYQGSS